MFNKLFSGVKEVFTIKGIGTVIGIVVVLAVLSWAGYGPEQLRARYLPAKS